MLKMIKGCRVPDPGILCEQYEEVENGFVANVNADKLEELFMQFIINQSQELFFILELPSKEDVELELRQDESDGFHVDVYYIDGLTAEEAGVLVIRYGELLINDGISRFGFGVADNEAEIMLYKYNKVRIFTQARQKYKAILETCGIPRVEHCVTAGETLSEENPGFSKTIKIKGKTVYDLPKELESWGIYFAERREE